MWGISAARPCIEPFYTLACTSRHGLRASRCAQSIFVFVNHPLGYIRTTMAGNADAAVADLLATARSARCHNAFFRQQQLKFLHDLLRSNAAQIVAAIEQDSPVTNAEATTEVAVVLNIVKEHHAAIDPKKELEEEYRVAKGRDALDRTTPWGVVYVEPSLVHTPLFSVVSPLAAALAAGNCVVMKVRSGGAHRHIAS